MAEYTKLEKIQKRCISHIQNEKPRIAIEKISEIRLPNNNNIGQTKAIQIYERAANLSVKYDSVKYRNNINEYKSRVDKNIGIVRGMNRNGR
jgi:hypothetical protein